MDDKSFKAEKKNFTRCSSFLGISQLRKSRRNTIFRKAEQEDKKGKKEVRVRPHTYNANKRTFSFVEVKRKKLKRETTE